MGKYVLLASSGIRKGQEKEFAVWHDTIHTPDVLAVPGVVAARRLSPHPATPAPTRHLMIYEIDADDPVSVLAEIGRRVQSGEMVISPTSDPEGAGMVLYEVVDARTHSSG